VSDEPPAESDDDREEPLGELADQVDERREIDDGSDADRPELPGEAEGDRSGPLGELATRIDRQQAVDDGAAFDDLFDEYDTDSVDSETLWEQVGSDEPFEVTGGDEPERRIVDKRAYCQSCPFFSEPPDVACTHQETEILDVVDFDHFEVFNCPVVREDESLENL
jgi:hypothetical protein